MLPSHIPSGLSCRWFPRHLQATYSVPLNLLDFTTLTTHDHLYNSPTSSLCINNALKWYTSGLLAGWSGIRVSGGFGNFSLHHCVQTTSGVHSASYPVGIRALSLEVKHPGCEADHSPPPSANIKNAWSCTSIASTS